MVPLSPRRWKNALGRTSRMTGSAPPPYQLRSPSTTHSGRRATARRKICLAIAARKGRSGTVAMSGQRSASTGRTKGTTLARCVEVMLEFHDERGSSRKYSWRTHLPDRRQGLVDEVVVD